VVAVLCVTLKTGRPALPSARAVSTFRLSADVAAPGCCRYRATVMPLLGPGLALRGWLLRLCGWLIGSAGDARLLGSGPCLLLCRYNA
jgi:hypothetical protein